MSLNTGRTESSHDLDVAASSKLMSPADVASSWSSAPLNWDRASTAGQGMSPGGASEVAEGLLDGGDDGPATESGQCSISLGVASNGQTNQRLEFGESPASKLEESLDISGIQGPDASSGTPQMASSSLAAVSEGYKALSAKYLVPQRAVVRGSKVAAICLKILVKLCKHLSFTDRSLCASFALCVGSLTLLFPSRFGNLLSPVHQKIEEICLPEKFTLLISMLGCGSSRVFRWTAKLLKLLLRSNFYIIPTVYRTGLIYYLLR